MDTMVWPAPSLVTVTPSDATVHNPPLRQLYVGTGGTVVVETQSGVTVTFANVPDGAHLGPFFLSKIKLGTTASNIVGFI
jgi:hypothetical protein